MKIELELEEINCLMNALNVAWYFYEKLNQNDRASEAQQVHDLLNSAGEIHAHVELEHMTAAGQQAYRELLRKREARLTGKGRVVELYRPAPVTRTTPTR